MTKTTDAGRRSPTKAHLTRRSLLKTSAAAAGTAALFSAAKLAFPSGAWAAPSTALRLEKDELKLGFIKLTDMAPLAIAKELGYFEDEGLFVSLEPQANWKVLLDGVIAGSLDGAHMLAGQPIASTIGFGTKAAIITPFSMDLNGNGITVSNEVWALMKKSLPMANGKPVHPIKAEYLRPVIEAFRARNRSFKMGMVFPVSTHNYELRYWLASGGIHPGLYSETDISGQILAEALLSVTPPPQMPTTLEAGTIDGYCVGEPWNQQAVIKGVGVPIITDSEIQTKYNPEKVFGLQAAFAQRNPNTTVAITKALIRACMWLDADNNANRGKAVEILSRSEYVGADRAVIANSMTGTFEYEKGDKRSVPDFNVFFRYFATYPYYSDAVWYLTQMRRWGQIPDYRTDAWYAQTAKDVYKPDIYLKAAKLLVDEGKAKMADFPWTTDGYRGVQNEFIDGVAFDGRKPNAYVDSLKIGLKGRQKVQRDQVVES
jgi:nitrate/nitrite transport system substrate-binding protein